MSAPSVESDNRLKLIKPRCRLNTRSSLFSERVVTIWYGPLRLVMSAPSVESFKSRLDNHWSYFCLFFLLLSELLLFFNVE